MIYSKISTKVYIINIYKLFEHIYVEKATRKIV
jgi:hypothetical protein